MNSNRCPVCGNTIERGICNKCGYVQIVFPSRVPEAIDKFERERVEILKKIVKTNSDQIASAQTRSSEADRRVDELDSSLRESMHREQTLKSKVSQLETQIRTQTSEILNLSADLTETKAKMKVAAENAQADAFLIFHDGNDMTVYPISNSKPACFASGRGHSVGFNGKEGVSIFPVITGATIAFEIQYGPRGYTLVDHCQSLRREGIPVTGNERLMNKDTLSFPGTDFKAYFSISSRKR